MYKFNGVIGVDCQHAPNFYDLDVACIGYLVPVDADGAAPQEDAELSEGRDGVVLRTDRERHFVLPFLQDQHRTCTTDVILESTISAEESSIFCRKGSYDSCKAKAWTPLTLHGFQAFPATSVSSKIIRDIIIELFHHSK